MEIRIRVDQTEPPSGQLLVEADLAPGATNPPVIPFVGWLGLLRALDEAFHRWST